MEHTNDDSKALKFTLKPYPKGNSIGSMDVTAVLIDSGSKSGERLFRFNLSTVNIPFCELTSEPEIMDFAGILPYHREREENGFLVYDHFVIERDSVGILTVSYNFLPRVQPDDYRSSPYFDFVCEDGGGNGAGLTFLPNFGDEMYDFSLNWILEAMPTGSRGIWCLNEGNCSCKISGNDICFSYFACGAIKSFERENFGFYWLSDPPFPVEEAVEKIQALYLYMADFFNDSKEPYKVFTRKNRFNGHGGTALLRSYMFGYGMEQTHTTDSLIALFAHEMVHNWPHLKDEPYGSGTWYSEGMAEFYCTVLPYRCGIYSLEKMQEVLNEKTTKYYANPTRGLSDEEASKLFWTDRRTQRIAYGRGLLYIANVDAQIRRASDGKKSVDDVMLDILSQVRNGKSCNNETWLELISRELPYDVEAEFKSVVAGELITSLDGCFEGLFRPVPDQFPTEDDANIILNGYRWELK